MNKEDKLIAATIVLMIDIFLIYLLPYTIYKEFIYIILSTHALFIINLYYDNKDILDFLHIFVFIIPTLVIFIEDVNIVFITILFLSLLQVLWIGKGRCILNSQNKKRRHWGFGKKLRYYTLYLSLFLSFKLGKLNFNPNTHQFLKK